MAPCSASYKAPLRNSSHAIYQPPPLTPLQRYPQPFSLQPQSQQDQTSERQFLVTNSNLSITPSTMPSLSPLFPGFGNRRNRRNHQPEENNRKIWQTCKTALIRLLPRSCFANERRKEEVEQMLFEEEMEQEVKSINAKTLTMAQTPNQKHKPNSYDSFETADEIIKEESDAVVPTLKNHVRSARNILLCELTSQVVNEESDPVSPMPTQRTPSEFNRKQYESTDQVVPSGPNMDPLPKPDDTITELEMKIMAEELEKEFTNSQHVLDTEMNNGYREEDSTNGEAGNDDRSCSESGNSVDSYDIADLKRLAKDKSENSNAFKSEPVPQSSPMNQDEMPRVLDLGGRGKQISFSKHHKENRGKNEDVNHPLNPFYMNQDLIQQNMHDSEAGPSSATQVYSTAPVPSNITTTPSGLDVPEYTDGIWGVSEERIAPNGRTNQETAPLAPQTISKLPFVSASTPTRSAEDHLDDLFKDVRNFLLDVEEALQKVTINTQKCHVILDEKLRLSEIELRRARQNSEITLLLQKVAECERSNTMLRKCLQSAGERFVSLTDEWF